MVIDPSALESYREIMGDEADEFISDILETYFLDSIDLLETLDKASSSGSVASPRRRTTPRAWPPGKPTTARPCRQSECRQVRYLRQAYRQVCDRLQLPRHNGGGVAGACKAQGHVR